MVLFGKSHKPLSFHIPTHQNYFQSHLLGVRAVRFGKGGIQQRSILFGNRNPFHFVGSGNLEALLVCVAVLSLAPEKYMESINFLVGAGIFICIVPSALRR